MKRITLCAALAVFCPAVAFAQADAAEESARHHFRLGQAHYESGAFLEAAHEFEQSFEQSGRPELLFNIYVSYRDANDDERARDALRGYLDAVPDAPERSLLRGRLAALDRTLGDGSGSTEGESDSPDGQGNGRTGGAADSATASGASAGGMASEGGGGLSPVGFIVGGVGAAMLIAGAVTGGLAISASDELAEMCPTMRCPAGYDHASVASTGSAMAVTTDVLIPVGAAALVAGVILIIVLQEGGSDEVATRCGPQGCDVAMRF